MIRSRGRLERVLDLPPFSSIHLLPDTAGNQPIFPAHEEHEDHRARPLAQPSPRPRPVASVFPSVLGARLR